MNWVEREIAQSFSGSREREWAAVGSRFSSIHRGKAQRANKDWVR